LRIPHLLIAIIIFSEAKLAVILNDYDKLPYTNEQIVQYFGGHENLKNRFEDLIVSFLRSKQVENALLPLNELRVVILKAMEEYLRPVITQGGTVFCVS